MFQTLLLFFTLLTVHPRVNTVPTIVKQDGAFYTVENPASHKMQITFNCGLELQPTMTVMYPNTVETFELRTEDGHAATCWLDEYHRVP